MTAESNTADGSAQTILVTGATGAQGGSVARHLMERGRFRVRALTRNLESDAARALQEAGADVVQGDLADPGTLGPALEGCRGVYGVTNFWEHFGEEETHGRNLVDAVAASGVEHFIFSSLPSVKRATGGELDVPHFELKANIERYARERDLPATFINIAFYYENFLAFFPPRPREGGGYSFGFPQGDTPLEAVSVEDVGGVVAPMFERRDEFMGQTVPILGDSQPAAEYARQMSEALDAEIAYEHTPRDVFAGFDFPGAADLAHMFDFYSRFPQYGRAALERCRTLYPAIRSFEEWLGSNQQKLRAAIES